MKKKLIAGFTMVGLLVAVIAYSQSLVNKGNSYQLWALDAIDATGLNSSSAVDGSSYQQVGVQVVHADISTTSAIYELQVSNDGSNWDSVSGSSTTVTTGSGSNSIDIDPFQYAYIRVTTTTASKAGTLTPRVMLKKKGK